MAPKKSETFFSHEKETITVDEIKLGTITSNYAISHATITVNGEDKNELFTKSVPCEKINQKVFSLGASLFPAELHTLAKEDHLVTITCRLGTGEIITVYQGTLVS